MTARPILLDVDTGIDDALAILHLLGAGGELIAAGSVHGNVPALLGAKNTLRVLEIAGRTDIPVRVGAAKPMAQPLMTAEFVHGDDGLGNTGLPEPKTAITPGSAAEQIVDLARSRPGEFTLVAVGPLTNLGIALLMEPDLPSLIPEVMIMGGADRNAGNVTPTAEANTWHDPEAAALVIEATWQKTFVTLDATMQTLLTEDQLATLANATSPKAKFAWSILDFYLNAYENWLPRRTAPLHDPLAVALALDPTLATYKTLPTRVELRGAETRGTTVTDRRYGSADPDDGQPWWPVRYVDELDVERFQAFFLSSIVD
jgi:purine nucleosidase